MAGIILTEQDRVGISTKHEQKSCMDTNCWKCAMIDCSSEDPMHYTGKPCPSCGHIGVRTFESKKKVEWITKLQFVKKNWNDREYNDHSEWDPTNDHKKQRTIEWCDKLLKWERAFTEEQTKLIDSKYNASVKYDRKAQK
jgi:hypothetical protein